jgi:hypothetical protein
VKFLCLYFLTNIQTCNEWRRFHAVCMGSQQERKKRIVFTGLTAKHIVHLKDFHLHNCLYGRALKHINLQITWTKVVSLRINTVLSLTDFLSSSALHSRNHVPVQCWVQSDKPDNFKIQQRIVRGELSYVQISGLQKGVPCRAPPDIHKIECQSNISFSPINAKILKYNKEL